MDHYRDGSKLSCVKSVMTQPLRYPFYNTILVLLHLTLNNLFIIFIGHNINNITKTKILFKNLLFALNMLTLEGYMSGKEIQT